MPPKPLSKSQIGACGEILVQLRLLQHGIDSARLTTDAGIDLVAFAVSRRTSIGIQVKTNLRPKPSGGKGPPHLDWWIPEESTADYFALVDLSRERIWLFTPQEISRLSQQHPKGRFHIFMAIDPPAKARKDGKVVSEDAFRSHLFAEKVARLLRQTKIC